MAQTWAGEGRQDTAGKGMLKVMLQQRKTKLETPAEKAEQPAEGTENIKHQTLALLLLKSTRVDNKACGGRGRCCRISEKTSKMHATN